MPPVLIQLVEVGLFSVWIVRVGRVLSFLLVHPVPVGEVHLSDHGGGGGGGGRWREEDNRESRVEARPSRSSGTPALVSRRVSIVKASLWPLQRAATGRVVQHLPRRRSGNVSRSASLRQTSKRLHRRQQFSYFSHSLKTVASEGTKQTSLRFASSTQGLLGLVQLTHYPRSTPTFLTWGSSREQRGPSSTARGASRIQR